MSPKRISYLISAALTLIPGVAYAYSSPEDILFSPEFTPPPTSRTAQQRVEMQQETSAERRAAAYEQLKGSAPDEPGTNNEVLGSDPEFTELLDILRMLEENDREDVLHPAAGEEPDYEEEIPVRSTREDRILDRIESRQMEGSVHGSAPLETLHGGAPLSHTGPGLVVAGTSLLLGTLYTMRRSGKMTGETLGQI